MTLPPADLPPSPASADWWDSLSDSHRTELLALCDPRQDECFFGVDPEGGEPPAVRGGRFLPHDDAWGLEEWGPDWFDHLMEHPEWVELMRPVEFHVGGVCTAHPTARAALAAGHIPAEFTCPFTSTSCPMRRFLESAPGFSVRLVGAVSPNGTRRVLALPTV